MDQQQIGKTGRGPAVTRRTFLARSAIVAAGAGLLPGLVAACASPTKTTAPSGGSTAAPSGGSTASGAAQSPKLGGTLITAMTTDTSGLDPQLTGLLARVRVTPLIYSGLVKLGTDISIQPDLAESWVISTDGKKITFKLRKGAMWHPPVSREVVADDIKYSFERLKAQSPGAGQFASIAGITAPDPYTVEFDLTTPDAGILAAMADPQWGAIVNRETVQANGDLQKTAVGTGPFMFVSWQPDQELQLKRNPNYFIAGRPYLDGVVVRIIAEEAAIVAALRAGQIQHTLLEDNKNYDLLKGESSLTSYRGNRLGFDHIVINHKVAPFDNEKVRQAISWAIDRDQIIQAAAQGYATQTAPMPPALVNWQIPESTWRPYSKRDVAKAKTLLSEAGFADGFSAPLYGFATIPSHVAGAQVVQANLKEIGINLDLKMEDAASMIKRWQDSDFGIEMNTTGGGADPASVLGRMFYSKGEDWPRWSNVEVDQLLDEGKGSYVQADRKMYYDQVQNIVLEQAALLYTFCPQMIDFTQANVQGFRQHPKTALWTIDEVWLD